MNPEEHVLTKVAEECGEISKAVTKALCYGLDDRNPNDPAALTNEEEIVSELNDLMGTVMLAVNIGIIPAGWWNESAQIAKSKKILRYMEYARSKGTLKD